MSEVHGAQWEAYKEQVPLRFMPLSMGMLALGLLCLVVFLDDDLAKMGDAMTPFVKAVIILTFVTCALALMQLLYFRRNLFLKSQTPHLLWCIGSSGAVALANCFAVVLSSPYSYEFYLQLSSVFRCMWVYHYLLLLLSFMQPHGGGGKEEVLQAAGKIFTEASLPPGSYAPPFRLCTCASTYTPGPAFLRSAFRRVECYIAGTLLLACVKLTLYLEGRTTSSDAACVTEFTAPVGSILTALDIAVIFLGLSGVLALANAMEPVLLPSRRDVVKLRHRLFLYMQTFIAVQTVLIFGMIVPMFTTKCTSKQLEGLTIAAQMLLVQLLSYKAFIPSFSWGPWSRMRTMPTKDEMEAMRTFQFLVPVADMASKFKNGGENVEAAMELQHSSSTTAAAV
jgi:hypothetical protein